jgi:hypothetical protein
MMHDELFGLLVEGNLYSLSFGRLFLWRWLLRLESEGEAHRCSVVSFIVLNCIHAWLGGFVIGALAGILTSSHDIQALVSMIAGIALFCLNTKDWLK